jgi:hypothetical protein
VVKNGKKCLILIHPPLSIIEYSNERNLSIGTMRTRGKRDSLDESRYGVLLMSDETKLSII